MALMKAVRGAEIGMDTLNLPAEGDVLTRLRDMDDRRLFTVFEAIKKGVDFDTIFELTRIDRFFLAKLKHLADFEADPTYEEGKRLGYTDKALRRMGVDVPGAYNFSYKMVDTCAAEFAAETPYFYAATDVSCDPGASIARASR